MSQPRTRARQSQIQNSNSKLIKSSPNSVQTGTDENKKRLKHLPQTSTQADTKQLDKNANELQKRRSNADQNTKSSFEQSAPKTKSLKSSDANSKAKNTISLTVLKLRSGKKSSTDVAQARKRLSDQQEEADDHAKKPKANNVRRARATKIEQQLSSSNEASDWEDDKPSTSKPKKAAKDTRTKQKSAAVSSSVKASTITKPKPQVTEESMTSDEDESDWEDVEHHPVHHHHHDEATTSAQQHGTETLQITVSKHRKKTKCEEYVETFLRREINRFRKDLQADLHQIDLLMHIARMRHWSCVCNDQLIRALALSVVPDDLIDRLNVDLTTNTIVKFVSWFHREFQFKPFLLKPYSLRVSDLTLMLKTQLVTSYLHLAAMFVSCARAVGLSARIVCSIQPIPIKLEANEKNGNGNNKPTKEKEAKEMDTKAKKKSKQKDSDDSAAKTELERMREANELKQAKCDYWAELYLETEERWIAVNLHRLDKLLDAVDHPEINEKYCTQPMHYVLACDNSQSVLDVTIRYSCKYMTPTVRRLRTDHDWWTETMNSFRSRDHPLRDRLEDMQFEDKLKALPLPNVISDFKNHPLYVLERDLLKFEALYPKDVKPVGVVRNVPVLPRSAVHTLHNREGWLKKARVIKCAVSFGLTVPPAFADHQCNMARLVSAGEEPYKIVKGRPKFGVPKELQEDRPCPCYGYWQTEPYVPKPPVDGKIPRNDFGNVEIFLPCMQPPGTVHLQLPRLLDVAKKLDIDCAPVMTGWDFKGGRNAPVLDGFLVCAEFEETLVAAWQEEEQRRAERIQQRIHERALDNWKRLVKGLLLRHRVEEKFSNNKAISRPQSSQLLETHDEHEETESNNTNTNEKEPIEDMKQAWPRLKHQFTL